ncbi:MAG: DUF2911 domain-containing protein [Cyclobacteriaceae bacterium]
MKNYPTVLLLVFCGIHSVLAQTNYEIPHVPANLTAPSASQLTLPRVSQSASVKQVIGITEIELNYHRPGIYGRELLGGADAIIPKNQVWRAGANENTTISFSHAVKVNGNELAAGTYGLFMIPEENEWTIILSNANADWGSFFYDEKNDALRTKVTVQKLDEFKNWLSYSLENPEFDRVQLRMVFGDIALQLPINVDVDKIVIQSLESELRGSSLANPVAYNQAAQYCLTRDVSLDKGLAWSQRTTRNNREFTYLMTESGLLKKLGNEAEATELKEEAFSIANAGDLTTYGFEIMGPKFTKNRSEAHDAFKAALELNPNRAFPLFAMGKFHETDPSRTKKDIKTAIEYYNKARENTKIEGIIRNMTQLIALLESEL